MKPLVTLSPPVFTILAAFVEERIGIHYGIDDLPLFADKIGARVLDAGFDSALDYYYSLRYDDPEGRELDALTEALVVNETYFFREAEPLRILRDRILAPRVARGRRPRVWCAACSSGEEPLTLAMLLDESGLLGSVDIVATDISARALARAESRAYGGRSFRVFPEQARERWLEGSVDQPLVQARLTRAVAWRRLNLLDDGAIAALGSFDAVVCRNVLIYFSDETVRRVVGRLANALEPDGCLLVGASESLMRFGTVFKCEERAGAFFYVRATA